MPAHIYISIRVQSTDVKCFRFILQCYLALSAAHWAKPFCFFFVVWCIFGSKHSQEAVDSVFPPVFDLQFSVFSSKMRETTCRFVPLSKEQDIHGTCNFCQKAECSLHVALMETSEIAVARLCVVYWLRLSIPREFFLFCERLRKALSVDDGDPTML